MHHIIIGNGIAGITAARFIRKYSDDKITVISNESDHFFSRTALMYVYMGHMPFNDIKPYEDEFWAKNRISLVRDHIQNIDIPNQLLHGEKSTYIFDKLLLAPGSIPAFYVWPGQHLRGVQGLYHLEDLDNLEALTPTINQAVVIGGGLIGVELAEMLHTRGIRVTLLIREELFARHLLPPEEASMISAEIQSHGISLIREDELVSIQDDGKSGVKGITTKNGLELTCQFVGITTGVRPNIDWLKQTSLDLNIGIRVNQFLQTNCPGIFAAGDAAELVYPEHGRKSIEPLWYTGRMMGETAALNMLDKPVPYKPGIWFNAAKFFNLEFQVYGYAPPNPEEELTTFFWKNPKGNQHIRIFWKNADLSVQGILVIGVRFRQEVCERWIIEKTPIQKVVAQLGLAYFDPEGQPSPIPAFQKAFMISTNSTLPKITPTGPDRVIAFLKPNR